MSYGSIPKSQRPESCDYVIYSPHSRPSTERYWEQDYRQVLSIDPGLKHLGLRIERRYLSGRITTVQFRLERLAPDSKYGGLDRALINTMYFNSILLLDSFIQDILECHMIIIEKPLAKNYKVARLTQHILTYLFVKLKDTPLLPLFYEVDSKIKGRMLGAPSGISQNQLKKWSVEEGTKLLQWRGDQTGLAILKKHKRKHDLTDTIVQAEALFKLLGLPLTLRPEHSITPSINVLPSTFALQPGGTHVVRYAFDLESKEQAKAILNVISPPILNVRQASNIPPMDSMTLQLVPTSTSSTLNVLGTSTSFISTSGTSPVSLDIANKYNLTIRPIQQIVHLNVQ